MVAIEPRVPTAQPAFRRSGAAVPATVVSWRSELSAWLAGEVGIDVERRSDVVLAVDEALSNAAEFAYAGGGGEVTLDVVYAPNSGRLDISISDGGTWRHAEDGTHSLARGRGIQLMRALADRFDLDHGLHGTRVAMAFEQCSSTSTTSI